jgi:hypothetical protein
MHGVKGWRGFRNVCGDAKRGGEGAARAEAWKGEGKARHGWRRGEERGIARRRGRDRVRAAHETQGSGSESGNAWTRDTMWRESIWGKHVTP